MNVADIMKKTGEYLMNQKDASNAVDATDDVDATQNKTQQDEDAAVQGT